MRIKRLLKLVPCIVALLASTGTSKAWEFSSVTADGKPVYASGGGVTWYPILAKCRGKDGVMETMSVGFKDGVFAEMVNKHQAIYSGDKLVKVVWLTAKGEAADIKKWSFNFTKFISLDLSRPLTGQGLDEGREPTSFGDKINQKYLEAITKEADIVNRACDSKNTAFFEQLKRNVEYTKAHAK